MRVCVRAHACVCTSCVYLYACLHGAGKRAPSAPCRPAHQVLENRTKDSKLEMEVLENLQELKDLNQRQAHVDFEAMLRQHRLSEEERQKQEQEEDERETACVSPGQTLRWKGPRLPLFPTQCSRERAAE